MSDQPLQLQGCIGFSGEVPHSVAVHPDREHVLYPLGCNVVVEKIAGKKTQSFLQGHNDFVSCVNVSKDGKLVATGQQTHMGFEAEIIIWDFETRTEIRRFKLHRVKVQALSFSPSGKYLVSLGGEDDGKVAVWDVATGKALCSSTTGNGRGGFAEVVQYCNTTDARFLTGGNETLRVWTLNEETHKISATTVTVRGLRRVVKVIEIDPHDELAYCGTTSGDVIAINVQHAVLKAVGPEKTKFEKGVTDLKVTGSGDLLVGTGNGTVALLKTSNFKVTKKAVAAGAVTSLSLRGEGHEFFVATANSNMYRFNMADFTSTLRAVAHSNSIGDVQFPAQSNELFGTCAGSEIRIWQTATHRELLRITVPNKVCNAFVFLPSGEAIISGWSDGTIRCHLPESGRMAFEIPNANGKGVTSLAPTNDCRRLLSGGGDGQVRLWRLGESCELIRTLKEHAGAITSINVNGTDQECVTSSVDGSCIVWNLETFTRKQIIMANTLFQQVRYRPDEAQVLTVGTDRKVGYWEVFDGSLIREMEISLSGPMNGVDIAPDGNHYAAGGSDKQVKIFSYKEGERSHIGHGHSGAINRLKICPQQQFIVSVSTDGAILIWDYPHAPSA